MNIRKMKQINETMRFVKSYIGEECGKAPDLLEWNLKEFIANQGKYPTLCEVLPQNTDAGIKPFIDFDMKWDNESELPNESEVQEIYKYVKNIFL